MTALRGLTKCDCGHTIEIPPLAVRPCTVRLMERRRIDTLLTERGLADSRTSAAASVRAGRVRIGSDGLRAVKPGQLVPDDAALEVEERPRYVSRGGLKLQHALDALAIEVDGRSCLDV